MCGRWTFGRKIDHVMPFGWVYTLHLKSLSYDGMKWIDEGYKTNLHVFSVEWSRIDKYHVVLIKDSGAEVWSTEFCTWDAMSWSKI